MANQKIFCAVPWHNTHLYWDGTYGACCSESEKPLGEQKNINSTSIIEWYNSDTMTDFRERILGDNELPECSGCYSEEKLGHESRRIKENLKCAIFTEQAFDESYKQSSWNKKFVLKTDRLPIDWHIDFGNECNFACKMCHPGASSKIADLYTKWGIKYDKAPNWLNSEKSWNQFLDNVKSVPDLNRMHIMGGEPTVNKKFHQFINWLIDNKLTDISLSFVSNGTSVSDSLIDKLRKFRTVDIEISVESVDQTNDYIRQGGNYLQTWENISRLAEQQADNFQIVLRSVPQLLNINNYHKYIARAIELNLSVQSIPLVWPAHLSIKVLPYEIRQQFVQNFINLKDKLDSEISLKNTITTGRDISRLNQQLVRECDVILQLLDEECPANTDSLRKQLIEDLVRWDKHFKLDAREYYPEYQDFLEAYGYHV
jgi:pyruvate-formate lyase-activating enzyme